MDIEPLGFEPRFSARESPSPAADFVFQRARLSEEAKHLNLESTAAPKLIVQVAAEGTSWIGAFERGPEGKTGLFATPHPDILCVVATGQGFWVPIFDPMRYEIVPSIPIKQVLRIPEKDLIAFVDYVRITCYGKSGLQWQTCDISWDGIQLTEVTPHFLAGLGWDSPGNRQRYFSVDISTGVVFGGAAPTH